MKSIDGKLWFSTMGGVAIVDPKSVQINAVPPPVILEEIRLDDKAIDLPGGVEIEPGINSSLLDAEQPADSRFELVADIAIGEGILHKRDQVIYGIAYREPLAVGHCLRDDTPSSS
ncbi:MAG TPA: hypothetical protein VFQ92_02475, partial [Blastocatellia bacterium]|nr:hypothetical protein [Blastocatellia bacterium]